jgi:hypothetical protein
MWLSVLRVLGSAFEEEEERDSRLENLEVDGRELMELGMRLGMELGSEFEMLLEGTVEGRLSWERGFIELLSL